MAHMRQLGAYPTDSYYDPNRPSWVPYWLDTPTESALKFGLYPEVTTLATPPAPAPAPTVGVPATNAQGNVTNPGALDVLIAQQDATWKAQIQAQINKVAADEAARQAAAKCGWTSSLAADGTCQLGSTKLFVVAAGGLVLLLLLRRT